MPFFMIHVDTEAWTLNNFDVEAPTSGAALVAVLRHLGAIEQERLLHSIHVGPPGPPVSDAEMEAWPKEDHFIRLGASYDDLVKDAARYRWCRENITCFYLNDTNIDLNSGTPEQFDSMVDELLDAKIAEEKAERND